MTDADADLKFAQVIVGQPTDLPALFESVFTASEGPEEGAAIGALANSLLSDTPEMDIYACAANLNGLCVGCIIFSRLHYPQDDRSAFVLGPVAVATPHHGRGIGQGLIRYGLDVLRQAGVDIVLTYGDPAYYSKLGFKQISEADAQAPYKLQFPEGWQAQSLAGNDGFTPLAGPSICVDAFNNPAFW